MSEKQNASSRFITTAGRPYPFGVSLDKNVLNFSLVSYQATSVTLCLFDRESKAQLAEILLSSEANRTGACWHIGIESPINANELVYAYRVQPALQETQDLLLDPYAKGVATSHEWGSAAALGYIPYGEIVTDFAFDWEEDRSPNIPLQDLVIYEMHVRGFTKHGSSKAKHPGTFLGLIEKIPHLLSLGINAVELMPVQEFDETEYSRLHPDADTDTTRYNFWGYSTVNYFAPMNRYAASDTHAAAITEFKSMVKELHLHGIEVILDVVFNHTAEGNVKGPIFSFKGIDNDLYYMHENGKYLDFTGCGNTVNTNQAAVLEMILTCLRYWVTEMHVDGFRFDLASIFSRDRLGHPLPITPIIRMITDDPILQKTKLIAEPWDAACFYQVGSFAAKSKRWSEWNDQYRDSVRRFIKGLPATTNNFARRLSGSQDLYNDRSPCASINFITAHDGFTLADLVSYNVKHNLDNGEEGKDGNNHNESWNCGIEGITKDPSILQMRSQQMRNFHLSLMLSQGVPMLLMGDEYGHTKNGNNNTWCHDSELNWFDWDLLKSLPWDNFPRFFSELIKFRHSHPTLKQDRFLTDADIDWHGTIPLKIDWHGTSPFLAFTLKDKVTGGDLYAAFNPQSKPLKVTLPSAEPERPWQWVVNTANPSPLDFFEEGQRPNVEEATIQILPFSAFLLKRSYMDTKSTP